MEALGGYESDNDEPMASSGTDSVTAPHPSPPAVSAAYLADTAARTIEPDHDAVLPPGEMRPAAREGDAAAAEPAAQTKSLTVEAETPEQAAKRQKKDDKKAAKKEAKKEKKAAAATATAPAPKIVLPSAAGLLSNLSASALGLLSGNEADTEASPPASSAPKKYNALPPPASLLAADQLTEEQQWQMKPMSLEQSKKRRFGDIPPMSAPAASSTHAAAASAAASAGAGLPASAGGHAAHRHFAPPQITRKQANVSTEDMGNLFTQRKGRPSAGTPPANAEAKAVAPGAS